MGRTKPRLTNNLHLKIKNTGHFDKARYIGLEFTLDEFDKPVKILDAKQLPPNHTHGSRKWDRRVVCLIEVSNQYESDAIWADWGNIRRNRIRNPMVINSFGGYIGVGVYKPSTDHVVYNKWTHLWMRATEKWRSAYNGVTVSPLWRNFQNFAKWTYDVSVSNYKPFFHLDKDIFQWYSINKEYGPDTCVYIPKRLNNYLSSIPKQKGSTSNMKVKFGKESIYIPSYIYVDGSRMPTLQACRQYLLQVMIEMYRKHGYLNDRTYGKLVKLNDEIYGMTEEDVFKYSDPEIRRKMYNLVERVILSDIKNEK